MSKVLIEEQYLNDIGLAPQKKLNTGGKFYPDEMGSKVNDIDTTIPFVSHRVAQRNELSFFNVNISEV